MPKIGIDIGNASIKIIELGSLGRDKWKLQAAASATIPAGGFVDSPSNQAAITTTIGKIVKEAGIRSRRVVLALPEEQVSSHVVEMPQMVDAELEQALKWQVEQYVPIPADQAVWSWEVIGKDAKGGMEVMLVAVARNLVDVYKRVVEQAGLEVVAVETELIATSRAVVPSSVPVSLVVDIGAKSTDVGVVNAGRLVFARTVPTAGEAFTRAIETNLGLDNRQAEQYKNTYGFSGEMMGGKLMVAMKPVLSIIVSEIKKTIDFYLSKHTSESVKLVTLSGGIAALPDVVLVMSEMLGLEISVASPFARVDMDQNQKKALMGNGPFYSVAVGLAMRQD